MRRLIIIIVIFTSFLTLSSCQNVKNLNSDEIEELFNDIEISFENDFTFKYDYTDTLDEKRVITEFFQYNKDEHVLYIYNKKYPKNYVNYEDLPILEGYIYMQSYSEDDLILLNSISKTGHIYNKVSIDELYYKLINHEKFTMIKHYSEFLQIKNKVLTENKSSNVSAYKKNSKIYLNINNSTNIEYIIEISNSVMNIKRIIQHDNYVSEEDFYISAINNNLKGIDISQFLIY